MFAVLLVGTPLAAQEAALSAVRRAHVLVLPDVYLNRQGPFRMLLDTGSSSCSVSFSGARRIGLSRGHVVERVTPAGSSWTFEAPIAVLRVGAVEEEDVQAMVLNPPLTGVDGVLGQSWLSRHDYLLDFRSRLVVLDGAAPRKGIRVAITRSDGRPAISAVVDGRRQHLVVDSGAAGLILFEPPPGLLSRTAVLSGAGWSLEARTGIAEVTVGETYTRRLKMARLTLAEPTPGLLPAHCFSAVYISNRGNFAVLVP